MLAGVGGQTIAEAKLNISIAEFECWWQYRKKYGPLNPMLRNDAAIARLSVLVAAVNGHKRKASDFMPWPEQQTESIDDIELAQMKKMKGKRK